MHLHSLKELTAEARLITDMRRLNLRQRIRQWTDDLPETEEMSLREVVYREAHKRASMTLVDWVRQPCPATREAFIRAIESLETAERARRVTEQTRKTRRSREVA
jgi:hypothetical protein